MYTPQDILNRFPRVGTPRTQTSENITAPNGTFLYLGAGQSGVVRSIFGTSFALADWTDMNDLEMRVYIGAGDITNLAAPPAEHLSAVIPLGPLLGAVYHAAPAPNTLYSNRALDYTRGVGPSTSGDSFCWRLPVPFEDGILIQIWSRGGVPAVVPHVMNDYFWTQYEVGSTSFPYQKWRLKARSLLAHTVVTEDSETTIFDAPGEAGMLVGVFASMRGLFTDAGPYMYLEGNWRLYLDGESAASWETSGSEDLFGVNTFYFQLGEVQTPNWGVTYLSVADVEAYRLFYDDPIIWANGGRLAIQNTVGEWAEPDTDVTELNILALYYAPA